MLSQVLYISFSVLNQPVDVDVPRSLFHQITCFKAGSGTQRANSATRYACLRQALLASGHKKGRLGLAVLGLLHNSIVETAFAYKRDFYSHSAAVQIELWRQHYCFITWVLVVIFSVFRSQVHLKISLEAVLLEGARMHTLESPLKKQLFERGHYAKIKSVASCNLKLQNGS